MSLKTISKNKNKEPFRRKLVKFYYTIKGFFKEKKMKIGRYYTSEHLPNRRYMYRGERTFFFAHQEVVYPGVAYSSQDKVTYKYWEIGILNFK